VSPVLIEPDCVCHYYDNYFTRLYFTDPTVPTEGQVLHHESGNYEVVRVRVSNMRFLGKQVVFVNLKRVGEAKS
jgi:hypothetical protein